MNELSENIKVYCRFRPHNEFELSHSTNNSVILLSQKELIITQDKKLELKTNYEFDCLFEYNSSKEVFYNKTSRPIVSAVLQGYNGGIICYGETGTGKTYTLNEIIPRVVAQLFEFINQSDTDNELFKIDISIIEIYKEQVNDLIDKKNTNLNLIEQKNKKLVIDNLTHIGITSEKQLNQVINKGLNNRNSNSPTSKEHNSKSHFIIMITLYHYFKEENYIKIGKLYLVDLEGSERISKTRMVGETLEEQKLINKSLIALSRIVQNLSNEDNISFIPYRDSKLTRIISDCFGGNAYTTLILNCSKHEQSTIETRNTLMFGEKVKRIKNTPIINIENNAKQSIIMGEIFGISNYRGRQKRYRNDDRSFDINLGKNDILSMNKSMDKSLDRSMNKSMDGKENRYLKMQVKHLKEKMELDNSHIEQLNEKNNLLMKQKNNLMYELGKLANKKKDIEQEEMINSFYIKNNINDLHSLLNEKEVKEKYLINEINSMKMIFSEKIKELTMIINEKQREIEIIKEEQNENINTCQELTECLNEASNQIKIKEKIIEELIIKNENNNKENNDMKNVINNLKMEKEIIKNDKLNKVNDDINNLNKTIIELNNELKKKEMNINELNKEKIEYIKIKGEYDNKINEMNNTINKMKIELKDKNLSIDNNNNKVQMHQNEISTLNKIIKESNNNSSKLMNENLTLKNKIEALENNFKGNSKKNEELINENNNLKEQFKLLENNYNNLSQKNGELLNEINKLQQMNNDKSIEANNENISKINELQNQIIINKITKNKTEMEITNLRQENKNLVDKILKLEKSKKEMDSLKREIKSKNKNMEEFQEELQKIIEENDNKINDINDLKNELQLKNVEIETMSKENNRNKNLIENLRKEIIEKNKIMDEKLKKYQAIEKENNNVNILKNNIETNNKYIYDIKQKNERIIKENNENKKKIENLLKEINAKTKIIEETKVKNLNYLNSKDSDKKLIEKLKKEICSKNYTIMEYKAKLDKLINDDTENKKTINYLKNGILSKEKIINDYSSQILSENRKNDNVIVLFDDQEKQTLLRNIETMKEAHIKEINRYKEIIKQKETEIIRYRNNSNEIYELQKIINELRKENSQLYLKVKDYDSLKEEIQFLYKRGGNYSFKETNKTTLKLAYDALIEENRQLKEKIAKLQKNNY